MEPNKKWVKIYSGKTQDKNKIIECVRLEEGINAGALFYNSSQQFYHIFRTSIGKGIYSNTLEIPDITNLGPVLINLHFSIELALKSLVLLKTGKNDLPSHELKKLLKYVAQFYPEAGRLLNNRKCINIINTLSTYFNMIRYSEVTVHLQIDRQAEDPFRHLLNTTDTILQTLWQLFKENSN